MKYKNAAYEEKLDDLILSEDDKPSLIDNELVLERDSNCELNRFLNIMEKKGVDGDGHNEGFVVLVAAATDTGEPVQVSAIAYRLFEDGSVEAMPKSAVVNYNIQVSDSALEQIMLNKEKADNGEDVFDIFRDAGISAKKYKNNINGYVHTLQQSADKLNTFFNEFSPDIYPIISIGRGSDKSLTYSQEALKKVIPSEALANETNIDFARVIMEYSYRAYYDEMYEKNAILDEDTVASFSLEDVVRSDPEMVNALSGSQRSEDDMLVSTKQKAFAVAMLADEIRMQNMELFDPEQFKTFSELHSDDEDEDDDDQEEEENPEGALDAVRPRSGLYDEDIARILMQTRDERTPQRRKRDVVMVEGDDTKPVYSADDSSEDSYLENIMAERSRRANERMRAQNEDRPFYLPRNDESSNDRSSDRPYYLPRRDEDRDNLRSRPYYIPGRNEDSDDRRSRPYYIPRRDEEQDDRRSRPYYLPRRDEEPDDRRSRPYYLPRRDEEPDDRQSRPYYTSRRDNSSEELGNRSYYRQRRDLNAELPRNDEVNRLLAIIEEQQKMIARKDDLLEKKDEMLVSTNNTVTMLTEKLTKLTEQHTALLEKLTSTERQNDEE